MPLAASPTRPSAGGVAVPAAKDRSSLMLALFFVAILIPFNFQIASLAFYPLRFYVVLVFVPYTIALASGRGGRWTGSDSFMVAFSLWMTGTIVLNNGIERLPYGAVLSIEAFGGYALGRVLIRSLADYRRFFHYYMITLLIILPFALREFAMPSGGQDTRFGFARVKLVFPHPILYGLFCSMGLAGAYYLYRDRLTRWAPRVGLVIVTTMMSLSSAPLLSMTFQLMLIGWDRLTKSRWKLFVVLAAVGLFILQMVTTRGVVYFLINRMTFTPSTGYTRVIIWQYGSASVMNYPLFGIGLNDWVRAPWLPPSVDNFWLVVAMRHGLPALGFLWAAIALHIVAILRVHNLDPDRQSMRTGYLVTLLGMVLTLATVHIWNEVVIFVMFYIGAGSFLYTASAQAQDPDAGTPAQTTPQGRRSLPLSRFQASAPAAARPVAGSPARSGSETGSILPKAALK